MKEALKTFYQRHPKLDSDFEKLLIKNTSTRKNHLKKTNGTTLYDALAKSTGSNTLDDLRSYFVDQDLMLEGFINNKWTECQVVSKFYLNNTGKDFFYILDSLCKKNNLY